MQTFCRITARTDHPAQRRRLDGFKIEARVESRCAAGQVGAAGKFLDGRGRSETARRRSHDQQFDIGKVEIAGLLYGGKPGLVRAGQFLGHGLGDLAGIPENAVIDDEDGHVVLPPICGAPWHANAATP